MTFGMALLDADLQLNRPLHLMEQALAVSVGDVDDVEKPLSTALPGMHSDAVCIASGDSVSLPRPFVFRVESSEGPAARAGRDLARAVSVNTGFRHDSDAPSAVPDLREVAHLGASHLQVFVYDPIRDRRGRGHPGEPDGGVDEDPHAIPQHAILQAAADASRVLRERRPHKPQQCPLVIVVTRLEEWCDGLPVGLAPSGTPVFRDGAEAEAMRVIETVSENVRDLLVKSAPELVTVADHHWRDVTYVPVSFMGLPRGSGSGGDSLAASRGATGAPLAPSPVWCDVPLLVGLAKARADVQVEVADDAPHRHAGGHR
jgi:hypothetical protein